MSSPSVWVDVFPPLDGSFVPHKRVSMDNRRYIKSLAVYILNVTVSIFGKCREWIPALTESTSFQMLCALGLPRVDWASRLVVRHERCVQHWINDHG